MYLDDDNFKHIIFTSEVDRIYMEQLQEALNQTKNKTVTKADKVNSEIINYLSESVLLTFLKF